MEASEIKLKASFLDEATQLLSEAERCYLELEKNPSDHSLVEKIFRHAHNLKGSSQAVGYENLGKFTHELESFILKIKEGHVKPTSRTVGLLLKCNDQIRSMIERLRQDLDERSAISPLSTELQKSMGEVQTLGDELAAVTRAAFSAREATHPAFSSSARKESPISAAPAPNVRVSAPLLDQLYASVTELSALHAVLRAQVNGAQLESLRRTTIQLGKVCKEVRAISTSLRMIPMKQIFQKMERVVRDTAKLLGKEVQLEVEGEDVELDKTLFEAISDPLVHLIRNAVDHGIEAPDERVSAGKSRAGRISIRVSSDGGRTTVEVSDDGRGIRADELVLKAIEKDILPADSAIDEAKALELIFVPGFSTKGEVSEISGRGIGMDVVKTNITDVKGEVQVKTVVGSGTSFKIDLPPAAVSTEGLVVQIGCEKFAVPLIQIHETLKPEAGALHRRTGMGEVLLVRGEALPAFRLSDLTDSNPGDHSNVSEVVALIIRAGASPFAVLVDDVLGQQEFVIKSPEAGFESSAGYPGSVVFGEEKPIWVLDLPKLVHASKKVSVSEESLSEESLSKKKGAAA